MLTVNKENILDFELAELEGIITDLGQKKFRAKQVFGWLAKGVTSFDEMNNVPAGLRELLDQKYYIGQPEVITEQRSSKDGTRKCLYGFRDLCVSVSRKVDQIKLSIRNHSRIFFCRLFCTDFYTIIIDGLRFSRSS